MHTVDLPVTRPFRRRVFRTLVPLYFVGNLAGIPLLRATNIPIEPVWTWAVATLIAAAVIALGLCLANRTGLGAPWLEGAIPRDDFGSWVRSGLALTLLLCVGGFPLSLLANLDVDPTRYPFGWELLPASFKAGVVEEIVSRLFLVSLFVWLGSRLRRDDKGRPAGATYWLGIVLAGLLFGWAHVDAQRSNPAATMGALALLMALSSLLGIYFGWLFWKLGLEWAMFAHFAYDVFVSMIVVPVYLLRSPAMWVVFVAGMAAAAAIAVRALGQDRLAV